MQTPMAAPVPFDVEDGFADDDRDAIARMYWSAFGPKLGFVLSPESRALDLIARRIDPACAIVARSGEGRVLGVAGYRMGPASFVAIDFASLKRAYGTFGALWRGALLSMLKRPVEPGTLLMDGIFVSETARGSGVGTRLLAAVKARARALDCRLVRLDVVDGNPRARALYEREGFRAVRTIGIGPLSHVFGFRRATTMTATVD